MAPWTHSVLLCLTQTPASCMVTSRNHTPVSAYLYRPRLVGPGSEAGERSQARDHGLAMWSTVSPRNDLWKQTASCPKRDSSTPTGINIGNTAGFFVLFPEVPVSINTGKPSHWTNLRAQVGSHMMTTPHMSHLTSIVLGGLIPRGEQGFSGR